MCRFAGEALQFYKRSWVTQSHAVSNKRAARAHGSAIGCGVLPEIWRRKNFHYGHIVCRQTRRSWQGPCSRRSTVVSEAAAYLNSDRMLWLFWLAIESA